MPNYNTTIIIWRPTFDSYTLTSLMSLLLLYPETLGTYLLSLNLPSCCHVFPSIYHMFLHWSNPLKSSTKCLYSSGCHRCNNCDDCNVDFVLFSIVTHYNSSHLSCIRVNATHLLNITCTLIVACVILGRLECMWLGVDLITDIKKTCA